MDELESRAPANQPSLVRPYTLTAGRTDSRIKLPLEATVEAIESESRSGGPETMCGHGFAPSARTARRSPRSPLIYPYRSAWPVC